MSIKSPRYIHIHDKPSTATIPTINMMNEFISNSLDCHYVNNNASSFKGYGTNEEVPQYIQDFLSWEPRKY
ncbi:hypothetical protein COK55_06945 [Bacillus cereus]|nr:hypothetical protein COK55_06945 [Bacillus cereus]